MELNSLALFLSVRVDFHSSVMFTCVNKIDAIGAVTRAIKWLLPGTGKKLFVFDRFSQGEIAFQNGRCNIAFNIKVVQIALSKLALSLSVSLP